MNVVKVEYVNHFAVVMMIVDTVKYVKILFVQPDVDQMLIARVI